MSGIAEVRTLEETQAAVRDLPRVAVRGEGSKTALSREANLDLSACRGMIEYEPSEYTFTAYAGTPLREIEVQLREHGQFLPFDPVQYGGRGTIGGCIASGLAGSGRMRYGGVRDFLLGVKMVNGKGDVVRGGGKVVKNAAGFDIPKLLVGSLGSLGVIVEATFKVFPLPAAYSSLRVTLGGLREALRAMELIARSPLEPACLDLLAPDTLFMRFGGMAEARDRRVERAKRLLDGRGELIASDEALWQEARTMAWVPEKHALVKITVVPSCIEQLESHWNRLGTGPRRYSVGGNVLWLAWPHGLPWEALDRVLSEVGRPALVVTGDTPRPLRCLPPPHPFAQRLRAVFDPQGKFAPEYATV